MALGRIMSYDRDSGMSSSFYRIDGTGHKPLNNEQMFPGHGKEEKYRLSVLLKTVLDEFPTEKLLELLKTYNVSEIVSQFLGPVNGSSSER